MRSRNSRSARPRMRWNTSRTASGMMPGSCCVPCMVKVFPVEVWPSGPQGGRAFWVTASPSGKGRRPRHAQAKIEPWYPSTHEATTSPASSAYSSCVRASGGNTRGSANRGCRPDAALPETRHSSRREESRAMEVLSLLPARAWGARPASQRGLAVGGWATCRRTRSSIRPGLGAAPSHLRASTARIRRSAAPLRPQGAAADQA